MTTRRLRALDVECLDATANADGSDYAAGTYCGEPITLTPGQTWAVCPRCGCGWAPEALQPARRPGDSLRAAGWTPVSPRARQRDTG